MITSHRAALRHLSIPFLFFSSLLISGCGDSAGPDNIVYPADYRAVSNSATSDVRVFVNNGSGFTEVDASATRFAENGYFDIADFRFDDIFVNSYGITLLSDSTWVPSALGSSTPQSYTVDGSAYRLLSDNSSLSFIARFDGDEMIISGLASLRVRRENPTLVVSQQQEFLYNEEETPMDYLEDPQFDTIAFRTCDVRFRAD